MTTTDNSRADALTDAVLNQLIDLGAEAKGHQVKSMSNDGHAGTEAWEKWHELRDQMRAILAASPVEQHEAAPADVLRALRAAKQFIANGVALGFIRMPDSDCPDPAHETPRLIDAAIASLEAAQHEPPAADDREAMMRAREDVFDWQSEHGLTLTVGAINDLARLLVDASAPSAPLEGTGNGADVHATTLRIVHEESERTLSQKDFDMCMRMVKAALSRAPRTEVAGAAALPPVKGVSIDGGYVIVTPAGGRDKAPAIKAAILALAGAAPNQREAPTDEQILEIGYRHFKQGHNVKAEANFVAAVREILAALPPSADAAAAPADFEAWLRIERARRCDFDANAGSWARAAWQAHAALTTMPSNDQVAGLGIDACIDECIETLVDAKSLAEKLIARNHLDAAINREVEARAAASQPAAAAGQEAVAMPYLYVYEYDSHFGLHREFSPRSWNGMKPTRTVALYTAPPAQVATRQGLTDEQRKAIKWAARTTSNLATREALMALLEGAKR
ncbi:hypothetical protein [Burkholderia vietnamiensis]|uniref:hypothetical protein n=1 Tax=Burkholderia vietnamiensis TaxID=60552 RepID=UPI0015938F06|nr:hypothetical protein [Burkholderia vietnamiensis]